jgi:cytochrome c-type biogenesis protein CcmH/NrfG
MPDFERPAHPDAPNDPADNAAWDAVEEATELLHEERFHEALVELRDVIRREPRNPYAFYFLGVTLYETGELEAARDAYRAALRFAPQHLGAKVALVHVLRTLGDLRDAIKVGTDALEQAPADADVLYALGQAYLARGDTTAARRYLEAFLDARPEFELAVEVKATLDGLGLSSPRRIN